MSEMNRISEQVNRDYSMDILRIMASLAVVLIHVSARYFLFSEINSFNWKISNLFLSCTRWCVPIFFMLSGCFLLDKKISIKILWKKYVLRLLIILISWNVIYHIPRHKSIIFSISDIINLFFSPGAGFHLWFLYSLIGIYIVIPFLHKIVQCGLSRYLLLLWFLTCVFLRNINFPNGCDLFTSNIIHFPFCIEYIGYFVLGYFLNKEISLSINQRKLIYSIGCVSLIVIMVGTYVLCRFTGNRSEYFYDYLNIFNVLVSIALFVFFRYDVHVCYKGRLSVKMKKLISLLSFSSLGVYLIHVYVLIIISKFITYLSFDALYAIPIIWLTTTVISFIISFILSKIPVINILVK